jgi:EpsD family peptidyl-prolyl cis-trans isomerase
MITVIQSKAVSMRREPLLTAAFPRPDRLLSEGSAKARPFHGMVLAIGLLAAACRGEEEPKGQVIATVNGEEITLAELNEEARARGLAIGQDPKFRAALMRELIDRKLLVQEAERQGFADSPQYLLAKRRLDEILLAQQLLVGTAQAWNPSDEEARAYIAANPHAFDRLTQLSVDQIAITQPVPAKLRQALATAPTLAAKEQVLKQAGIQGTRSRQVWSSAALPREWAAVLLRLQPGQTFALPQGSGWVIGQLVSAVPQPLPPGERLAVARAGLDRQRAELVYQRLVQSQRNGAAIRYQPGFAPGK